MKKLWIAWDCVEKFDEAWRLEYFRIVLDDEEREEKLGGTVPENFKIVGDSLVLDTGEQEIVVYIKGESFAENAERLGKHFSKGMTPPDAYVDKDGVWHDDNEIWADQTLMAEIFETADDVGLAAMEKFLSNFYEYLDNDTGDEDYLLVVDAHC